MHMFHSYKEFRAEHVKVSRCLHMDVYVSPQAKVEIWKHTPALAGLKALQLHHF